MAKKNQKIEKEMISRLAKIGVKSNDEETAKEAVIAILEENGVDGMDDESLETLIEIAESFVEVDETESAEVEEEETEEEETEEEETEEEETEEEEEPEQEPVKPAKKAAAKVEPKKAATTSKKAETKPAKKAAAAKAEEPKKAEKKTEKKSAKVKLDPKNNEKDRKYFDVFDEILPEKEYERAWLATNGVNFKHIGKNGKTGVVLVEQCVVEGDDVRCNLYFNKNLREALEANDVEFERAWNDSPMIKKITFSEVIELVEKVIETAEANAKKKDKKLGDNRKKMEAEMKAKKSVKVSETATNKKPAKKAKK